MARTAVSPSLLLSAMWLTGLAMGAFGHSAADIWPPRFAYPLATPDRTGFAMLSPSSSRLGLRTDPSVTNKTYVLHGQTLMANIGLLGRPNGFHVFPAEMKEYCGAHAHTSALAAKYGCLLATNGGFYDPPTGHCLGTVVSDGTVVQDKDTGSSSFGMFKNGSLFAGYMDDALVKAGKLQELITGRVWLVRNGASYVDESAKIEKVHSSFVTLHAPRTAIGYRADGSIIFLVVDGIEFDKVGPTLYDMADMLIDLDVVEGVNLDGGGSTIMVYDGQWASRPTCHDTKELCERNIDMIACAMGS